MRKLATILLLFSAFMLKAQNTVSGIVRDASTGKPLPFATIVVNDQKTFSSADGKFTIPPNTFRVSYTGFHSQSISPANKYHVIRLHPKPTPGDNRANAIIAEAIKSRANNDPSKALRSFRYKAHSKLFVTANPDSIMGQIDTIRRTAFFRNRIKIDSTQYKVKRMMQNQHFFASEKTSVYEFDGDQFKETVTGSRMSGFKEPLYEVMGLNFQSFSIYDDPFELFETRYRSPLSRKAQNSYEYALLDTLVFRDRAVYAIHFKSVQRWKSPGLEGLLYVDSENFGIAKSVVCASGILKITATQEFQFHDFGVWFPKQRMLKIEKGNSDEDIRILGETIKFDSDTRGNNRQKQASDFTQLISMTAFSDFELDIPVSIFRSSVAIEVKKEAISRPDSYWNELGEISQREANTYIANDSIAEKEKIERKLRFGRKIINGYVPFGAFDFDLRHLISYNNYEGFRFGIGGITNDKFSSIFRVEGYTAYGTKDGRFKYNIGNAIRVGQFTNSWIGASYTDDVREIASTTFATDKRVFKLYDPRPINVSTFYSYQTIRGYIETRIIPKTESIWQATKSFIRPEFDYVFLNGSRPYNQFNLTMATVSLQWNPFSDFMQTPAGRFETEKRFPKFSFQVTKSFSGFLDGNFDFLKLDLRGEYERKFLDGQKSSVLAQAGLAYGDVPLTHLYSTSPNNLNRDALLQRITLAGKNSFETMYFNEFFSSHFFSLQLKHQFKRMPLFRKVKPSTVLVTRMVWGTMEKPEQHLGINYKTLDEGFFESGVEINQIYKGLGFSTFYRYGPYQLPRFEHNLSIKISFIINIGI